jgi:hypothetical protein
LRYEEGQQLSHSLPKNRHRTGKDREKEREMEREREREREREMKEKEDMLSRIELPELKDQQRSIKHL